MPGGTVRMLNNFLKTTTFYCKIHKPVRYPSLEPFNTLSVLLRLHNHLISIAPPLFSISSHLITTSYHFHPTLCPW